MMVPLAARSVIAVFGVLLVFTTWGSVIGTLIVPRPAGGLARDLLRRLFAAAVAVHQHWARVGVQHGQPWGVRPQRGRGQCTEGVRGSRVLHGAGCREA